MQRPPRSPRLTWRPLPCGNRPTRTALPERPRQHRGLNLTVLAHCASGAHRREDPIPLGRDGFRWGFPQIQRGAPPAGETAGSLRQATAGIGRRSGPISPSRSLRFLRGCPRLPFVPRVERGRDHAATTGCSRQGQDRTPGPEISSSSHARRSRSGRESNPSGEGRPSGCPHHRAGVVHTQALGFPGIRTTATSGDRHGTLRPSSVDSLASSFTCASSTNRSRWCRRPDSNWRYRAPDLRSREGRRAGPLHYVGLVTVGLAGLHARGAFIDSSRTLPGGHTGSVIPDQAVGRCANIVIPHACGRPCPP